MVTIEYRIQYTGIEKLAGVAWQRDPSYETVRVRARDINSGFGKALKRALEPLGNGRRREIGRIEFWQVVGWQERSSEPGTPGNDEPDERHDYDDD
jgi:hypothetical protein